MNQTRKSPVNETQRYALLGVLFGILFPVIATLIRVGTENLPFNPSSILLLHASDPLLWIIDTAPVFLGLFAAMAGRRQDILNERIEQLHQQDAELRNSQATLEQRVVDRTRELEDQSRHMRVVAEVARDVTSAGGIAELLDRAGSLIHDRYGFHQIAIFLLDTDREYAVLAASPTEAGRQLIADGLKLRVGEMSIVGRVALAGEPRLSRDTGRDAAHIDNPLFPNTRSEMALPLKVKNKTIGVLDVHSDQPQAFSEQDLANMQHLADQLAIGIERARLLEQVEENLKELQQAYGRSTRESWKSLAESRLFGNLGYRFDNVRIQPIRATPELGAEAIHSGNPIIKQEDGDHESKETLAAIPIRLRGQSIGAVTVRLKEGYHPNTISTLEQAVERLAASLESARLFEEARLRADREQAISQLTSAISSAPEFDAILRTTVEEIGRTLGDSEVGITILEEIEHE